MNIDDLLNDPIIQALLGPVSIGAVMIVVLIFITKSIRKSRRARNEREKEIATVKLDNLALREELRQRIIDHINYVSRVILLNPVVPGNTLEDNSLEGRNRSKCLAMIVEGLPPDIKGRGIRMAEFLHELCDHLIHAYGKEDVTIKIDAHPIILEVESAASVALMFNELISNALQYAPVPGEKSKVNIFFKERDNKLVINVSDNGIGMKSPYQSKFCFGLQLTNTLVRKHKGEMIFSSRPGTRVEILLSDYTKAIRDVYITPTTKIY